MIPKFNEIMKPLLQFVADGNTYHIHELINLLVDHFRKETNITDEELKKLLKSGRQSVFDNRVGWAKTYLLKAKLIESPKKAHVKITDRGTEVLKEDLKEISVKYLRKFPEFCEFIEKKESKDIYDKEDDLDVNVSPEELVLRGIEQINNYLKEELLEKILSLEPEFFEKFVVELVVKLGYGGSFDEVAEVLGRSGDEGVDGVIKQDILGLDNVYLQAKRWKEGVVGRKEIQSFAGALIGKGAKKGIFITTSSFTKEAIEYASSIKDMTIVLIDKDKLLDYMIKFNVGVQVKSIMEIKKIDEDYFEEI